MAKRNKKSSTIEIKDEEINNTNDIIIDLEKYNIKDKLNNLEQITKPIKKTIGELSSSELRIYNKTGILPNK